MFVLDKLYKLLEDMAIYKIKIGNFYVIPKTQKYMGKQEIFSNSELILKKNFGIKYFIRDKKVLLIDIFMC